jgi:pimeloyl-ACP methyl ester carboxylesterase
MTTVTSNDGTTIDYETVGEGPPVILVDGAMCFRDSGPMRPIARALATAFTVVLYDRRGRGRSGDTPPSTGHGPTTYGSVERELEDLGALIAAVGAPVSLFGISSGAALSLRAAIALGPGSVGHLVMFEPPYLAEELLGRAAQYTADLTRALAEGRREDALETFMRHVGVPEQGIAASRQSPTWQSTVDLAPTLGYDDAVMGDSTVPADAALVTIPVLTLASSSSPPMLHHGPEVAARVIPGAVFELVDGTFHEPDSAALAARIIEFVQPVGATLRAT